MEALQEARFDQAGIDGDAHRAPESIRQVLVHDHEVNEELGLTDGTIKENVTLAGVNVNELPYGTRLALGEVVLELTKECAPCSRMEEIRTGLQQRLVGRRGALARVVTPGTVRVGDQVRLDRAPDASAEPAAPPVPQVAPS
jgi:MOSC domain-containing protein YiiM